MSFKPGSEFDERTQFIAGILGSPRNAINSRAGYMGTGVRQTAFDWSLRDPAGFWGEAGEAVYWYKRWEKVLDDSHQPFYR